MSDNPTPAPVTPVAASEDKTVAIIGYLTGLGLLIATILHGKNPTAFGAFHLRQMLGLMATVGAAGIVAIIPVLGWIAWGIIALGAFVFWIMAFISAINGEKKPLPIVGAIYQDLFKGAFVNSPSGLN